MKLMSYYTLAQFKFAMVNIILFTVNFIAGWVKCNKSVEIEILDRILVHWRWL